MELFWIAFFQVFNLKWYEMSFLLCNWNKLKFQTSNWAKHWYNECKKNKQKKNSKSKVSRFCRKTFISLESLWLASLTFFQSVLTMHMNTCVQLFTLLQLLQIFCKLNSLCDRCTNIPFRAFNRFYDKLLINEKFIETNWTCSHPWKHTLAITHLYSSTQFSPSSAKLSLPFSCKDRLGLCFIYFPLRINPSVRIRWVRAR